MKKVVFLILLGTIFIFPLGTYAQRGCCSWHGGVAGCDSSGRTICADGSLSPSCTCSGGSSSSSGSSSYGGSSSTYSAPGHVYGCTDSNAINYNANATADDGSCIAKVEGCMDSAAINYNASANTEDGSCQYQESITEKEQIKYKTEYQKNNELEKGTEKVVQEGKNGEKEVTYLVIKDKDGNIISKEKSSEKTIAKAQKEIIEQGTKESSGVIGLLWIISIIVILICKSKPIANNLLINKIKNKTTGIKILLYIGYFIFVIPVFIDVILLIINKTKNKKS